MDIPLVDGYVRSSEMVVDSRGFSAPWAMYTNDDREFWLNSDYPVYQEPNEKFCPKVARTQSGC